MAAITAAMVNDLRQRTGLGMMECKAALSEANGDIAVAIDNLRKKGVKAGVAARAATEGKIYVARSADGKTAAAVEVLCNTDFTAKSEPVLAALKLAAETLVADPRADLANHAKIKEQLVAVSQQTGENVTLGRSKVLTNSAGSVGTYLYAITQKIGVLVSVNGAAPAELLGDLCMHITACKPVAMGMTRDAVPADLVSKEKEIAVEQAKATGKPQQIAEKIAEGKLNAFFKERVLGEQDFINAEKFKGTVNEMLKKAGVTLVDYVRLEVGV
jgi:elongation factor Ts